MSSADRDGACGALIDGGRAKAVERSGKYSSRVDGDRSTSPVLDGFGSRSPIF